MEIKNKSSKFLAGLSGVFLMGLTVLGFKVQDDQKKIASIAENAGEQAVAEEQVDTVAPIQNETQANQESEVLQSPVAEPPIVAPPVPVVAPKASKAVAAPAPAPAVKKTTNPTPSKKESNTTKSTTSAPKPTPVPTPAPAPEPTKSSKKTKTS